MHQVEWKRIDHEVPGLVDDSAVISSRQKPRGFGQNLKHTLGIVVILKLAKNSILHLSHRKEAPANSGDSGRKPTNEALPSPAYSQSSP